MLGAYRPLFADPAARRLVAASLTGRLSIGIFDLPLIALVEDVSGSYALAGGAVGAHAAGVALSAPARGRLLDRHGTRTAMPPLVTLQVAVLAALPLCAGLGEAWLLVVIAALAGLTAPSFAAAARLEWQRLLAGQGALLERAYAFETSAQIGVFVLGGLVAAVGLAAVGARATLVACAVLTAAGGVAFAAWARAAGSGSARAARTAPIRAGGVRTLVAATLLADVGLGTIDVAVAAFAIERGQAWIAGVLLALFAAASLAGGVAYGARTWRRAPSWRLMAVLAGLAAVLALLSLAGSVLVLGLLLVLAGPPSAAQWATVSVALDRVAPGGTGAEAYNWLSTANAAGFALGGLVAGVAVEAGGTDAAFLAAAVSVALAAAVVATRRASLSRPAPD